MLFSDSFLTINAAAKALFKDRGSKFFAFAFPVKSEQEIKVHLQEIKKLHPSATHHCYAWRLGADKLNFRTNDDGEPNNSAGKPIFSLIQSNDLTNVLIVVVRYFGGTMLGVPGLINAYKSAAALAIDNTIIMEQFIMFQYRISFGMEDMSAVMRLLKELETKIISNNYEAENQIDFLIKKQHNESLMDKISELYRVRLNFTKQI